MTVVILFVFGAIVGSFLNVVGLRFNSGLTLRGRSSCSSCGKKLTSVELIPILSFFILRGRCSLCRTNISWQYALIEIWTGLVFATIPFYFIPVFCIYIVITIYDFRHKIIPDSLVYLSILSSLIFAFFSHTLASGLLAGFILFNFFALVWLLSRGRAMGFGDAKLALSVGILLGLTRSLSAIVLAFWIGAAFGLSILLWNRFNPLLRTKNGITIKSEIPFAPFIIIGAWLAIMFNLDILYVSLF